MSIKEGKLLQAMKLIQDFMFEDGKNSEFENLLIDQINSEGNRTHVRRDLELVDEILKREAKEEIRRRSTRRKHFGHHCSRDSIFLILATLFERKVSGLKTPQKYLYLTTGLPSTTVINNLRYLEKVKAVKKLSMKTDARVSLYEIEESAFEKMAIYFCDTGNVSRDKREIYGRRVNIRSK